MKFEGSFFEGSRGPCSSFADLQVITLSTKKNVSEVISNMCISRGLQLILNIELHTEASL